MDDVAWYNLGEIRNNDIRGTHAPVYSMHGFGVVKGAFSNEKLANFLML